MSATGRRPTPLVTASRRWRVALLVAVLAHAAAVHPLSRPSAAAPAEVWSYDDPEWPPDPTPGGDDDEPSGVGERRDHGSGWHSGDAG